MKARQVLKIASWFTLLCVATVVGLWWAYVRAPGPNVICEHIIEVTMAESRASGMSADSESRVIERTRDECIQHKRDKIQLRGRVKYATYAKCVMASTTLEDIYSC